MYITNRPEIAKIAENAGVDRIFVDMEYIGKAERQGGMDTVQCHHTIEDVQTLRQNITKSELMVRVNPIHESTGEYCSSEEEINRVIDSGADIVMLPFFKTVNEVKQFIEIVGGRAKSFLLLETPEAVQIIDDILKIKGIDEIHIGINDLSLGYKKKFMFELLADGTVERLCCLFKKYGILYGFGGIASLGKGLLPAESIIMEYYRLGSTRAILSRSFCNTEVTVELNEISKIFEEGVRKIRCYEDYCAGHPEKWEDNRREAVKIISKIAAHI